MGNSAIDFPWLKRCVSGSLAVFEGPCVLHALQFNGMTTVGDVSVYDGVDNTGTLIGILILRSAVHVSCQPMTFSYDCEMETGIYIEYDGTFVGNFTALWK